MKSKRLFQWPISRWEEAIPIGNGRMGCLLWGSPSLYRVSLDRPDIWDRKPPFGVDSPDFTYAKLVQLAQAGDIDSIRRIFDAPYQQPVPTKLPVGQILIRPLGAKGVRGQEQADAPEDWAYFAQKDADETWDWTSHGSPKADNAKAWVDLRTGEACIQDVLQLRGMAQAIHPLGLIQIAGRIDKDFTLELKKPEFGLLQPDSTEKSQTTTLDEDPEHRTISQGSLSRLRYPQAIEGQRRLDSRRQLFYFLQPLPEQDSFGVVLLACRRRRKTDLYFQIFRCSGTEVPQSVVNRILLYSQKPYEGWIQPQRNWWKQYWNRSQIHLPNPFFQENWEWGQYLFASTSRREGYPMALQGVWTAADGELPPWKGDYHNDLNTQMSYYHYLKANRVAEGSCFVRYLSSPPLVQAGKSFARHFYGTEGLCLPAVMTIAGDALGGWPMYSLSPTNQAWLCQAFVDYARYTQDDLFIRQVGYPYLRESARCLTGLLQPDQTGGLGLPISSSPEVHDDDINAFLTPTSNYDLALMRYLLTWLIRWSRELGREPEEQAWQAIQDRLPALSVSPEGQLQLSPDENLTESHRHFSQAHGIHPLRLLRWDNPAERPVIQATLRHLESLGTRQWVGFSFGWMAELQAIAEDGEKASHYLDLFWRCFCGSNGFHLNGDQSGEGHSDFTYHPFTLEANFCACDALQEMLFFMQDGLVKLFPAVPAQWRSQEISFEHLRGEGGLLVSATLRQDRLQRLILYTPTPQNVRLKGWAMDGTSNPESTLHLSLKKGHQKII